MHVGDRVALAMRIARSIRCAACSGTMQTCTNAPATSLKSDAEVDLLLVVGAERHPRLLADDRDDAADGRAWRRRAR